MGRFEKMTVELTFRYIPILKKQTRHAAKNIMHPSVIKYDTLASDAFIKSKLPELYCAGSFSINSQFTGALKNLSKKDIYELQFNLDRAKKMVSIAGHPKLAMAVNTFIKEIPEFFYAFRPKTNEPDLPHHILSTFQQVIKHPEYGSFSQRKQGILIHAALLHDIGKALDSESAHADISVRMLKQRFEKLNMQEEDKNLILKLIEHHHYCFNVKEGIKSYKDYAEIFSENEFKLLKVLTESDIASKEVSIKNLRKMVENKTIFREQADVYRDLNALGASVKAYKAEFVA